MKLHAAAGVWNVWKGLKTSADGLKNSKWFCSHSCMPHHWKVPITPTITPIHQPFQRIFV